MKTQPVITSLTIKRLFGEYDVSITFNTLTVIVGKNGIGKTTILKIINGLVTGKNHIDYAKICESIELIFSDGETFCFGDSAYKYIDKFSIKDIQELLLNDERVKKDLIKALENNPVLKEQISEKLLDSFIKSFLEKEDTVKMTKDKILSTYSKNKDFIFGDKSYRENINKKIFVRYISTVNISANAGNSIDFGNSVEKNLLDLAIYEELRILVKNANNIAVKKFENQLNVFLEDSHKRAKLVHDDWVYITQSKSQLSLGQLSSGERQLIYILATVANTCGKPTLLLMDEPEVSMHLSWQEKIIDAIMNINPQVQIIAVTHSPGIVMNGHMDSYIEMKDIIKVSNDV
ncbi:AAA family ATPase [Pantoea piersonii]|uniref:AAA family ATPase n=1 Tax=Pantoea piersonii TaxID=2364647 RepID=UPI0028A2BBD0|nr:ATP-binding protein [Pantoea piersonii]